jgi:hypothetical protein
MKKLNKILRFYTTVVRELRDFRTKRLRPNSNTLKSLFELWALERFSYP